MITYLLIGITAIVSILAFSNRSMFDKFLFDPYRIYHMKQFHRFFTHGLVHADWMHLIINMFVLLSFGQMVEGTYKLIFGIGKGGYFYVLLYIGALFLSATPSYGKHKNDAWYTAVGASGAVSAIVFASIIMSPLSGIRFIFHSLRYSSISSLEFLYLIVYSAYMSRKGRPTTLDMMLTFTVHLFGLAIYHNNKAGFSGWLH
jgi:membrane associated rhomboid family serine protease